MAQPTVTLPPPRSQLPKDDFCTKGIRGGATMNLGHYKKYDPEVSKTNTSMYKHTFLVQDEHGTNHIQQFATENKGGLRTTRFGKGFQRKSENNIINPVKEILKEVAAVTEERKEGLRESRSQFLKAVDTYNVYDPITGKPRVQDSTRITSARPEGIRMVGDGLGPEAPLRGKNMLRDSSSRFFAPQYSGSSHEHRQEVLVKEGILQPKYTSVLQLGKKDMLSYGVEEQFSKSEYTSKSALARTGLVEYRQPGAYTPRKQFLGTCGSGVAQCLSHSTTSLQYNPSGDLAVTAKWGKGIDLDVRSRMNHNPIL